MSVPRGESYLEVYSMSSWSLRRRLITSTNSLVAIAILTVGIAFSAQMTRKIADVSLSQLSILADVNATAAELLLLNNESENLKKLIAF